jgi:hypothetical protein
MNPVLAEMLATRTVVFPDGPTVPLDYNISLDEGNAIQALIREIKPRVTLEVGCAYGVSTLFICEALAEIGGEPHVIIDPLQEDGWGGAGLFKRGELGTITSSSSTTSHRIWRCLRSSGRNDASISPSLMAGTPLTTCWWTSFTSTFC